MMDLTRTCEICENDDSIATAQLTVKLQPDLIPAYLSSSSEGPVEKRVCARCYKEVTRSTVWQFRKQQFALWRLRLWNKYQRWLYKIGL